LGVTRSQKPPKTLGTDIDTDTDTDTDTLTCTGSSHAPSSSTCLILSHLCWLLD